MASIKKLSDKPRTLNAAVSETCSFTTCAEKRVFDLMRT